jgi:hypothetical protein
MDIKKTLDALRSIEEGAKFHFAGEKRGQKPGDQVRGNEKATTKKSGQHPFAGRLVGASESKSILADLEKQIIKGDVERRLIEEYAQFNEAENEFVLYINGRPVAKYSNIADARRQRDQLLQKFPNEDIQLKQEFCDLIDIEEDSNMLPGLDSDSPIHGESEINELNLFKKKPKPEPVKDPDDYRTLFNKDPVSFNSHHPLDVKHYHNSRDYYEKTGINPLDAKKKDVAEADDDMFSSQDTTTGKYWRGGGDSEYQQLWNQLVPASGAAPTVEGELLRAASRLYYDWYNNGFGNNTSGAANFIKNYGDYYTVARAIQTIEPYLRGNNSDADSQSKSIERALEVIVDSVVAQIKQANGNYHPNTTDLFDLQDPDDPYEEPDDDWYAQDEEYDDEDDLDETRIIEPEFYNIHYKPGRDQTKAQLIARSIPHNKVDAYIKILCDKFGVKPNDFELTPSSESQVKIDEYGMTTGGTVQPTGMNNATNQPAEQNPADAAKQLTTTQSNINKLKAAGVDIPTGVGQAAKAAVTTANDTTGNPVQHMDPTGKKIMGSLGQELEKLLATGNPSQVQQVAAAIKQSKMSQGQQ